MSVTLIQPTAVDTPYPEHAANYLSQEPKLPTPRLEPEEVASVILDAAVDPARDVKVGAMSVMNIDHVQDRAAPRRPHGAVYRSDASSATRRPAHPAREALYEAGEDGRTRGRGNETCGRPRRGVGVETCGVRCAFYGHTGW